MGWFVVRHAWYKCIRASRHIHTHMRLTPHATHATHSAGPPRAGPLSHLPATIPTYFYTPQGLSRFASDIIIRGFDTPCKLGFYDGKLIAIVSVHVTLPLPLPLALPLALTLTLSLALTLALTL